MISQKEIIYSILESSDPIATYIKYQDYLKTAKFMIFDFDNFISNDLSIYSHNDNFYLAGLCNYKNTIFLDSSVSLSGISKARTVSCVYLDVNISTHIKNLIYNNNYNYNLVNFLCEIKNHRMQLNFFPSAFENSYNGLGMKDVGKTYQTILAFSMLDRASYHDIKNMNIDNVPNIQDQVYADKVWSVMKQNENEDTLEKHKILFCLIAKMYLLKWDSLSNNKCLDLLYFAFDEIRVIFDNELFFSMKYLQNDKMAEKFFGKVQPNAKDVLRKIENTTWDLLHISLMETALASQMSMDNIYYTYYFATADKDLYELIITNPIYRLAIVDSKIYTKRKHHFSEIISEYEYKNLSKRDVLAFSKEHINELYINLVNEIKKQFK